MRPLSIDKKTGFLESHASNHSDKYIPFDAPRKVLALKLALEMAEKGEMPGTHSISKAINVSPRQFAEHLSRDEKFKEEWENVLDIVEQKLVNVMVTNGQRPSGYMDRITWLRAYRSSRWNPDRKVQITTQNLTSAKAIDSLPTIIDAEVIPNPHLIADNGSKDGEK